MRRNTILYTITITWWAHCHLAIMWNTVQRVQQFVSFYIALVTFITLQILCQLSFGWQFLTIFLQRTALVVKTILAFLIITHGWIRYRLVIDRAG
jgi:hypothetical protein